MNGRRALVCFVLALFAMPISAEQHVEHDPSIDFGKYRTYAHKEGTPAARPEVQQWIEAAIDRELEGDGLQRVDVDADLHVKTYAYAVTGASQSLMFAYDPAWNVGVVMLDTRAVTTGTLIVDLRDSESGATVWRGQASKAIAADTNKAKKKIDALTRKMFRDYPPR